MNEYTPSADQVRQQPDPGDIYGRREREADLLIESNIAVRAEDWHTGWVIPMEDFLRHMEKRDEQVRAEERERIAGAIEASDLDSVERFTASDGYPSVAVLGGTEIRAKAARIARQGGSDDER